MVKTPRVIQRLVDGGAIQSEETRVREVAVPSTDPEETAITAQEAAGPRIAVSTLDMGLGVTVLLTALMGAPSLLADAGG